MKTYNILYSWFFSFIIATFIFFWDVKLLNYDLRYNILILLIPIIFNIFKGLKNINFKLYISQLFIKNKSIIFFLLFLFFQLVLVSYLYSFDLRFYSYF